MNKLSTIGTVINFDHKNKILEEIITNHYHIKANGDKYVIKTSAYSSPYYYPKTDAKHYIVEQYWYGASVYLINKENTLEEYYSTGYNEHHTPEFKVDILFKQFHRDGFNPRISKNTIKEWLYKTKNTIPIPKEYETNKRKRTKNKKRNRFNAKQMLQKPQKGK